MRPEEMKGSFTTLCTRYSIPEEQVNSLWDEIDTKYSETHRFYHNLSHISDLLNQFTLHQDSLYLSSASVDAILWSIFYHDIIYDPHSSTNEEDSAALFVHHLTPFLPVSLINTANEYILATKNHTQVAATTTDEALQLFLDIDLSILAASSERYHQYARAIRLEYSHYPDDAYQKGRSAVLRRFLGDGSPGNSLFASAVYRDTLQANDSARTNLLWEVEELSKDPKSELIFGLQATYKL